MALYHKWGVKTGFTFALQFFMSISNGLGGVLGVSGLVKFTTKLCLMFLNFKGISNETTGLQHWARMFQNRFLFCKYAYE